MPPKHHPQTTLTAINQVVQGSFPAKDRHNWHLTFWSRSVPGCWWSVFGITAS